ncbi:hypothetical protein Pelo_4790 [Pelomyxa schiedti]|nr:hypothetical protein Pelo_4790 [Pelomyxa schiedti]
MKPKKQLSLSKFDGILFDGSYDWFSCSNFCNHSVLPHGYHDTLRHCADLALGKTLPQLPKSSPPARELPSWAKSILENCWVRDPRARPTVTQILSMDWSLSMSPKIT